MTHAPKDEGFIRPAGDHAAAPAASSEVDLRERAVAYVALAEKAAAWAAELDRRGARHAVCEAGYPIGDGACASCGNTAVKGCGRRYETPTAQLLSKIDVGVAIIRAFLATHGARAAGAESQNTAERVNKSSASSGGAA